MRHKERENENEPVNRHFSVLKPRTSNTGSSEHAALNHTRP